MGIRIRNVSLPIEIAATARVPPRPGSQVEIQLLVQPGAEVEATCKLYGGGANTMGLLLTSAIPKAQGLDGELVRVLACAGAPVETIDGNTR